MPVSLVTIVAYHVMGRGSIQQGMDILQFE